MTGNTYRLLSALALFMVGCINYSAAAQLNMNHICALVPNSNLIASGTSCNTYFYCNNGVASLRTCGPGTAFNKEVQGCVPASEAPCTSGVANLQATCVGRQIGYMLPVPGVCYGYYYCGVNGPQRSNCVNGEHFDPISQGCVYPEKYPCQNAQSDNYNNGYPRPPNASPYATPEPSINLCNYIQNGLYFGSAMNCGSWNKCVNNVMQTGTCPKDFPDFNLNKGKCDYKDDVNCVQVTYDPMLAGATPTYGGTCNKYGNTIAADTCFQYYWCDGANYQLTQCQLGLFYDETSQGCVNRMNAHNNCNRCFGTTNQFVNQYSTTGCTGYLICKNGYATGSGTCPTGQYYNELAGTCSGTNPNFGCCTA